MSGKTTLTGKNLEKSLRMLKEITRTLEKFNVEYQLDAGTLLGVVRENRLLPWDTDMDIWVKSEEQDKLLRALKSIFWQGFRVRLRYQPIDDVPLKKGDLKVVKIRNRKFGFLKGDALLDIFIKYRHDDRYFWSEGEQSYVKKSVSAELCQASKIITFEGKSFYVPLHDKEYLTARYGDWKTPVKEWHFAKNDQAIEPSAD